MDMVSRKGAHIQQNARPFHVEDDELWILVTYPVLGQTHMKPIKGLDGRSLHLSLVVDDDSCVVLAVLWLGVQTKLGPYWVHAETNWV